MICNFKEITCRDFYSWYHVSIEQKLYQRTENAEQFCFHIILKKLNNDIFHIQYGFLKTDSLDLIKRKVKNVFSRKDDDTVIDYYKVLKASIEWFENIEGSNVPFTFKDEVLYDSRKIAKE